MNPSQPGLEFETDTKAFIVKLYQSPPQPPFSFQLTLPVGIRIQDFLGYMVVYGAKELYQRQLADLTPEEIQHLQKYLQSIGWDVEYTIETREQTFPIDSDLPETENNTVTRPVNYYLIDFKPADRALMPSVANFH